MPISPSQKQNSPGEVLEQNLELLYRVANRLTGNATKAEDLVSETIEIAFRAWSSFDGKFPKSWLIKILRNQFFQQVRKTKTRNEAPLDDSNEPIENNFWHAVDKKLEADLILEALDRVSEEYREAIILCDVEELDYAEVAMILEIPPATLRSRLFRGRKILRSKLVAIATN